MSLYKLSLSINQIKKLILPVDREIHEAIPDVMAVLHENPDLQRRLLDAASDTTSAAVVAPLAFSTYFSLAGDANIDHNEDDAGKTPSPKYQLLHQ